ncbi:unnamed protein product [Diabrotica balteata]|uniref:Uncharacterized protein n=1 Tax=Diabrotica balteata TaxID=107213 RepID=A0A9N9T2S6_DIABA|nr:unnamed protein product [Diabrotica balteata]
MWGGGGEGRGCKIFQKSEGRKNNTKLKASKRIFYMVLESEKVSIFKPRKDQCDVCVSYKERHTSKEDYKLHILKKNEAMIAKSDALSLTVVSDVLVITMDKLQLHNFSIYLNNTQDVHLYVWHEANGGVTSNEFTSCIVDFLKKQTAYKKFILISDGCSYQTRNKVLASALANLSKTQNVEIEQIILEKGHTMMEVDSVHSTLEKKFRNFVKTFSLIIDFSKNTWLTGDNDPQTFTDIDNELDEISLCTIDHLNPSQRYVATSTIESFSQVSNINGLGHTDKIQMNIDTGDAKPFKKRPFPMSPYM